MFDTDLIAVLFTLIPGFIGAAVFHALTPYPKRDTFDRIVSALLFTAAARIAAVVVKHVSLWIGKFVVLGLWTEESQLFAASVSAVLVGGLFSLGLNKGWVHNFLRKKGITHRTSMPTQWYSAFATFERYIVLNMKDGRRLYGWPKEWPDSSGDGHFILHEPGWLLESGERLDILEAEAYLIDSGGVEFVEFLRHADDKYLEGKGAKIKHARDLLVGMNKEQEDD